MIFRRKRKLRRWTHKRLPSKTEYYYYHIIVYYCRNDGSSCGRPYGIMSLRRKTGKIEIESEEDVLRVRKQIKIVYDPCVMDVF